MTKSELRKIILERRRGLTRTERIDRSQEIANIFLRNVDLSSIRYLHTFLAIEKFAEIDTMPICERVWREYPNTTIVVPKLRERTGEMDALVFRRDTELDENKWGIREPVDSEIVDAGEIDAVLVPGLCFDRRGHRVGYGKGFYDQFLSNVRPACKKTGLCYFPVVEKIDDVHDGDILVDAIAMPDRFLEF